MLFSYDGSWAGFLSCVFEYFKRKPAQAGIKSAAEVQMSFFSDVVRVDTDPQKARRVQAGLQGRLSADGFRQLYLSFLSELPDMENVLLDYIKHIFKVEGAEDDLSHPSVLKVCQVARMVSRESHRMKAFVRFALTAENVYYSLINPDFNVLPLITSHFRNRYADQRWVIFDEKRKYGLYYNLDMVVEVRADIDAGTATTKNELSEPEETYQTLWNDYIHAATILSRKNTALHLRHVPKRYWRYLTEEF